MMSRTAFGGLIEGSLVLKTWDGWALYDLAQGMKLEKSGSPDGKSACICL